MALHRPPCEHDAVGRDRRAPGGINKISYAGRVLGVRLDSREASAHSACVRTSAGRVLPCPSSRLRATALARIAAGCSKCDRAQNLRSLRQPAGPCALPVPARYCSRECQVRDWDSHKVWHKKQAKCVQQYLGKQRAAWR